MVTTSRSHKQQSCVLASTVMLNVHSWHPLGTLLFTNTELAEVIMTVVRFETPITPSQPLKRNPVAHS